VCWHVRGRDLRMFLTLVGLCIVTCAGGWFGGCGWVGGVWWWLCGGCRCRALLWQVHVQCGRAAAHVISATGLWRGR